MRQYLELAVAFALLPITLPLVCLITLAAAEGLEGWRH